MFFFLKVAHSILISWNPFILFVWVFEYLLFHKSLLNNDFYGYHFAAEFFLHHFFFTNNNALFFFLSRSEYRQAMMKTMSSTLVETVSIDYEDFNESFLTCGTCLCKYSYIQKILGCWDPRCKHEYLDRMKKNEIISLIWVSDRWKWWWKWQTYISMRS